MVNGRDGAWEQRVLLVHGSSACCWCMGAARAAGAWEGWEGLCMGAARAAGAWEQRVLLVHGRDGEGGCKPPE